MLPGRIHEVGSTPVPSPVALRINPWLQPRCKPRSALRGIEHARACSRIASGGSHFAQDIRCVSSPPLRRDAQSNHIEMQLPATSAFGACPLKDALGKGKSTQNCPLCLGRVAHILLAMLASDARPMAQGTVLCVAMC